MSELLGDVWVYMKRVGAGLLGWAAVFTVAGVFIIAADHQRPDTEPRDRRAPTRYDYHLVGGDCIMVIYGGTHAGIIGAVGAAPSNCELPSETKTSSLTTGQPLL